MGHNYMGHNYICHSYMGHNYMGHNYVYTGHGVLLPCAVRHAPVRRGPFLATFSAHADGERRGLDRVGGPHRKDLRQARLQVPSDWPRPLAFAVGMLRGVTKKRAPVRRGHAPAAARDRALRDAAVDALVRDARRHRRARRRRGDAGSARAKGRWKL